MEPVKQYCCQMCGQTINLEVTARMHAGKALFCPFCGDESLEQVSRGIQTLQAKCFAGINRRLVQLLFEAWAMNKHNEQTDHEMFVDYMQARISEE